MRNLKDNEELPKTKNSLKQLEKENKKGLKKN